MKNIILLLIIFNFYACGQESKKNATVSNSIENNVKAKETIYEYTYPDNTSDLIENHYIVLNGNSGLYYGTSDEFDEAREGYQPGFFVTELKDLKIEKNKIHFKLHISEGEIFTKPIKLSIKNSEEAKKSGYKKWTIKIPLQDKDYEGLIIGDTILFKAQVSDFDKRFVKKI